MGDGNGIEAFRLQPGSGVGAAGRNPKPNRKRVPRQLGAVIRGPIPLAWLEGVLRLPGRTPVVVALALAYQSRLEGSTTVRFTHKLMGRFRIAPRSASRTLERMQVAGLVRIHRPPGCCREIEILISNCDGSNNTCAE